jgi:hypothetical protein
VIIPVAIRYPFHPYALKHCRTSANEGLSSAGTAPGQLLYLISVQRGLTAIFGKGVSVFFFVEAPDFSRRKRYFSPGSPAKRFPSPGVEPSWESAILPSLAL